MNSMQAVIDNPILTFTHKTNIFQRIRMGLGMISFSSQKSDTKTTEKTCCGDQKFGD